ncbi:galactose oxidase [Sporormia fimetaria CBS 119925]|uniref:Galactose oxidase n=1 Tax=Sporormia fimetaria CBS 119925 TaxID=1340428 RepID=A0A6A6V7G9_9PLEO|nr:galactose oxidase [Sporormia fimetaria CBS 119925]
MEPAVAGALYAAESLLTGAVAFAKGITHPTLPLKAQLTHITSTPVPRSHHTISVIKGRAYIFGGEVEPGKLANNDMQVIILPSSGVLEADYTSFAARPSQPGGDMPPPRKGHTAVVIGDDIYIFGGEGVAPENGRVWVFSTISNSWSYLDSASNGLYPSHRAGHAAASADLPAPRDVVYKELAPQKPADPAKAVPEPADENTWGTIFVLGGKDTKTSELLDDAFAFDVRSRTWSNIPSPSGQAKEGISIELVDDRLYSFGGLGNIHSNVIQFLDVSPVWKHAEGGTTPLASGWMWEELILSNEVAPEPRAHAGVTFVTTGQGRHYLLVIGGEGEASKLLDDVWAFQLPSSRPSSAAAKDSLRLLAKRDTHETEWAEAQYAYVDSRGEEQKDQPGLPGKGIGARGYFALAKGTEVDGATAVVWGGLDQNGAVLGDGWMITMDR